MDTSKFTAWVQASRLPSQAYIFFPLLLGQTIAYCRTGQMNWFIFVIVHVFGLCLQFYIVYANDYADYLVDQLNTTYTIFSGGSRVLVDGRLSRLEIGVAAWTMVVCSLLTGGLLHVMVQRPLAVPFIVLSLVLLYAYSYPPIRLSYRGGGELLQMLGVGLVLPIFSYYAQIGQLERFAFATLWILLPTNLACAIATSLPDEPSDRKGRKRTLSVWLGNRGAKMCILGLNSFAITVLNWNLSTEFSRFAQLAALCTMIAPLLVLIMTYHSARPGTRSLFLFVFGSIVITLEMSIWMILFYATGHCTPL